MLCRFFRLYHFLLHLFLCHFSLCALLYPIMSLFFIALLPLIASLHCFLLLCRFLCCIISSSFILFPLILIEATMMRTWTFIIFLKSDGEVVRSLGHPPVTPRFGKV